MPTSSEAESVRYEEQARKALEEDVHYLTSVTQMADVEEVVACEEVFAANGIKLLDKGAAIDSGLRERLLKHVLLKPIDQSLAVKDGVSAELLAQEAGRLIAAEPYLQRLLAGGEEAGAGLEALGRLRLPDQFGFKLTVARAQQPKLFEHLLLVALISRFLAQRLQLSPQQCSDALLAGLMHDLGELHTDPALLARDHRISEEEMRYVDVHPITSYLIAKEIVRGHAEVARAVLQHQEKLDGSGYPYGLRGEAIGQLGRIVSIADACASIIVRFPGNERLSTLMRLNRQKFDPALIALLQRGLSRDDDSSPAESMDLAQIQAAAKLLRRWGEFSAALQGQPPPGLAFLFERMADLRVMLLQFGLNPDDPQSLQALIGDREIANEMAAAFDEVRWQITDLQRETRRRRETIVLCREDSRLFETWLAEIQGYLLAVTPPDLAAALRS